MQLDNIAKYEVTNKIMVELNGSKYERQTSSDYSLNIFGFFHDMLSLNLTLPMSKNYLNWTLKTNDILSVNTR